MLIDYMLYMYMYVGLYEKHYLLSLFDVYFFQNKTNCNIHVDGIHVNSVISRLRRDLHPLVLIAGNNF